MGDPPRKRPISEIAAERKQIRAQRRRRQGLNQSLPRMLERRSQTGRMSEAQQNVFMARAAIQPINEQLTRTTMEIAKHKYNKPVYTALQSKYQKLSMKARTLQLVIDNPGDYFWDDDKWKRGPRPPPPPPPTVGGGGSAPIAV